MILYLVSILGADALMILFNLIFTDIQWWLVLLLTFGLTIAVILIDGVFAVVIRRLPEKWFLANKKAYNVSKKEIKFWQIIGVRKWKDAVLELGMFTSFSKREVAEPNNPEYVKRFLLESNYGVVIHIFGIIFGFLVLFFEPLNYILNFGLWVALVNAVLNFLPLGALRFNTPRLQALLKFTEKKQQRLKEKVVNTQNTDLN